MTLNHERGFTLIEIMVVLAILGILAMIAYPSYSEHVKKTRRGEVQAMLLEAALEQESHRITNTSYSNSATTLGLNSTDHYDFEISNVSATSYTLTAKAKTTSPQHSDKEGTQECKNLSFNESGIKTHKDCW